MELWLVVLGNPKTGQPNKLRLSLDSSSPREHSINDGIRVYVQVYVSWRCCPENMEHGQRHSASNNWHWACVQEHPCSCWGSVIGNAMERKILHGYCAPIRLEILFSAVADALEWILLQAGVIFVIHYFNDYLTMGKYTKECLASIQKICARLGFPLKVEKWKAQQRS